MGALPSPILNSRGGYSLSSEAQAQLDQMQGDIGWPYLHARQHVELGSGVVYAFRFKTTEYNQTPGDAWFDVRHSPNVFNGSPFNNGALMMSFSECPGDFTSPQVLAQTYPTGERTPLCVGVGPYSGDNGGMNLNVAIRGKWTNSSSVCLLDENKTYYLNITSGFSYPLEGQPDMWRTPFIGALGNGQIVPSFSVVRSFNLSGYWGTTAANSFEFIKNRSAFYTEKARLMREMEVGNQQRVADCRSAIATGTTRTGRECAGLTGKEYPFK